MNIRCKHDGGKRVLRGVDPQTSIADLQLRVRKEMDIPLADDVALLVGFPPTPLLVDGLELTSRLASTALRDGDTITVKGKGTGVNEGVGRSRRAAPTKKRAASRSGGNLGISARSPQDKRVRRVRPTAGGVKTVGPPRRFQRQNVRLRSRLYAGRARGERRRARSKSSASQENDDAGEAEDEDDGGAEAVGAAAAASRAS